MKREGAASPWNLFDIMVLAAVVFATASFLVHEVYSLDVWWQVAIGRDILATGWVPDVDRYAAAALGRPYHDSHWLFQVLLAAAHRVGDMTGVQLAMVGLWGATLVLAYRACRRWTSRFPSAVLVFLVAMSSVERFLPRPEIVTFLAISAFWLLLQEGRFASLRQVALLCVLQVIWANSHGLFVIGPFMVGSWWAASAVRRLRGSDQDFSALSRALVAVLAATMISPFGPGGWRYAVLLFAEAVSGQGAVVQTLGELGGTFGETVRGSPSFWFYAVLLGLSLAGAARSVLRRSFPPQLWIVAGLCAASLTGRRNIVLFALAAAPFVAQTLGALVPRERRMRGAATAAALLIAGWAWLPLSGSFYRRMEIPARWGFGVTPSFFPHGLPDFLDRIGFEGPVLNSNTLGGFYLYHGYPRRLPLTDGRWEVHDPERLRSILARSRDGEAWTELVGEFDVAGILLAHTSPEAGALLPNLSVSPDWRLVYYDLAASFWLREGGSAVAPRVDLGDRALLPAPARPDDGLILNAFLAGVGARELRITNLERTLALGARLEPLLEQLGLLQIETGRMEDARGTFELLLEESPRNTIALNELAFLAYRRGDLERAATLMERLVAVEPDNESYRENQRRIEAALDAR